jgi:hypothetical protein
LVIGALGAQAANRPPLPSSGREIAPGFIPRPCTTAAELATQGYYFSDRANGWIQAPFCYGKWGNLDASGSQIVAAGARVTVRAIPNGGSNSATYAPQTGAIQWQYPGQRVDGCGAKDLTCTVVPATASRAEWQWLEFHVSMPRTYFIDSPGDLCGGMHLCAGVTTNAWTFVGIAPTGSSFTTTGGGLGSLPPLPLILAAAAAAAAVAAAWKYNWRRTPAPPHLPGETTVGPLPSDLSSYAAGGRIVESVNPPLPTVTTPGGGGAAGGVGSAGGGGRSAPTDPTSDAEAWDAAHPDPAAADPTGGGSTSAGQQAYQQKVAQHKADVQQRAQDLAKASDAAKTKLGAPAGQAAPSSDAEAWDAAHPDPAAADPTGGGSTSAGQQAYQQKVAQHKADVQQRVQDLAKASDAAKTKLGSPPNTP